MLNTLKSPKYWAIILLNIIFLGIPIVENFAFDAALSSTPLGFYFVNSHLIPLVQNGWFQLGIVLNAVLDVLLIGMILKDPKASKPRKTVYALLALGLVFVVIVPIVSSIDYSSFSMWLNRLIGGF